MAREKRELTRYGLARSVERAERASAEEDSYAFFAAVAECLWWITTLDEALRDPEAGEANYESTRDLDESGKLIPGLRYARDRLVHDALATGMQGNPLLPDGEQVPWRWRPTDDPELPPFEPRSRQGREVGYPTYRDRLAGADILESLDGVASFLAKVAG